MVTQPPKQLPSVERTNFLRKHPPVLEDQGAGVLANMNENDEEAAVAYPSYDVSFNHRVEVGSWTSSSSATLVGDDGGPTSDLDGNVLDHRLSLNERHSSSGSNPEITVNNFVTLRPLYTSVNQPVSEPGAPSASDVKLVQRSRKGHRKSRQGCFNCKRRKIKCQETMPACDNCIRKELTCKYPAARAPSLMQVYSEDMGSPNVPVQLQTTPIFSLVDMRFFHHFIFQAYPHLPVGNDAVWVRRIPAVAYHYEYLMHAILAQAASHLTVTTDADYSSLALSHRLLAIKGLNEALSKTPRTGSDGDALLAACYALTFQTANMKDGMSEFLTMVRGCGLVALQLMCDGVDISFSISPSRHLEVMQSRLENLPAIDADLYEGGLSSLNAVLPLCRDVECLVSFHKVMRECFEAIGIDSRLGYYKFYAIYQVLGKMDQTQFSEFSSLNNSVSYLLLAHFVACEIIMAPIMGREWRGRTISTPLEGTLQWLYGMRDGMPANLRCFLDWPVGIASRVKAELRGELPQRPWLKDFFKGGLL